MGEVVAAVTCSAAGGVGGPALGAPANPTLLPRAPRFPPESTLAPSTHLLSLDKRVGHKIQTTTGGLQLCCGSCGHIDDWFLTVRHCCVFQSRGTESGPDWNTHTLVLVTRPPAHFSAKSLESSTASLLVHYCISAYLGTSVVHETCSHMHHEFCQLRPGSTITAARTTYMTCLGTCMYSY